MRQANSEFDSFIRSIIRTTVPVLVGSAVSWLAVRNIHVDSSVVASFTVWLVTVGYYLTARICERLVDSRFGWLLGVPGEPSYNTNVAHGSKRPVKCERRCRNGGQDDPYVCENQLTLWGDVDV